MKSHWEKNSHDSKPLGKELFIEAPIDPKLPLMGRFLILALILFFLIGTYLAGLTTAKVVPDHSLSTYASQTIARGDGPYKSYIIMHPPLAYIPGALAVSAGRLLDIDDFMSVRIASVLMILISFCLVYVIGTNLSAEWLGGVLAAAAFGWNLLIIYPSHKSVTKVIVILLSLFLSFFIQKRSWVLAGMAAGCLILTWAGGPVFLPAVYLVALLQDRDRRLPVLVRVTAGLSTVLLSMIIYLASKGTLINFWQQYPLTIYNYARNKLLIWGVSVPKKSMTKVTFILGGLPTPDQIIIVLGVIGLVACVIFAWRTDKRLFSAFISTRSSAVIIPCLFVYFGILFDFQSMPDLIPIIPYLSVFAGWLVWQTIQFSPWCRKKSRACRFGIISAIILITALSGGRLQAIKKVETADLMSQRLSADWLDSTMDKEKAIQVLGNLSPLIMTLRTNATRVIDIGPKSRLAMESEGKTIEGFMDELDGIDPILIVITLRKGHRREFKRKLLRWLADDYIKISSDPLIYANKNEPGAFPTALGMAYAHEKPFLMKADHLVNRGDLHEAESWYKKAVLRQPTEAEPIIFLGNLYRIQGDRKSALETYQRASQIGDSTPWTFLAMGDLYSSMGEEQEALQAYQRAIEGSEAKTLHDLPFPADAPPSLINPVGLFQTPHSVSLKIGGYHFILGYGIEPNPVARLEEVNLTLDWWSLKGSRRSDEIGIQWLTAEGDPIGVEHTSQTIWNPGYPIRWTYRLPLPDNAPAGEPLRIRVRIIHRLPLTNHEGIRKELISPAFASVLVK